MRVAARAPRRPLPPAARPGRGRSREGQLPKLLIAFVLAQMALQLLLVLVDLGPLRTLARVAAFGLSLAYLVVVKGPERRHPARGVTIASACCSRSRSSTPRPMGSWRASAQTGLYLAILAPLFWTARMRIDAGGLRTLVFLFWAFHAVSSVFGVLQVQFPGRFQPNVSAVLKARGDEYLEAMSFESASGEQVLRPMGLTDTPGGAATSGLYTVLLGTGLLLSERRFWRRALYLSTMVLGMACIYMSQVRVALVMLAISLFAVGAFFALRGMVRRIAAFLGTLALVAGVGLSLALSLGGSAVSSRLETLTAANPGEVYQSNRGHFLEATITDLVPQYPLGAGARPLGDDQHLLRRREGRADLGRDPDHRLGARRRSAAGAALAARPRS